MNTEIIKKGDEVFAKVIVTVEVEIFLGEDVDVSEPISKGFIWGKLADTDMGDIGEQVIDQMNIEL
jgi:hypothetical protein